MLDQAALIARFANAISRDRDSISRVFASQGSATETFARAPRGSASDQQPSRG